MGLNLFDMGYARFALILPNFAHLCFDVVLLLPFFGESPNLLQLSTLFFEFVGFWR